MKKKRDLKAKFNLLANLVLGILLLLVIFRQAPTLIHNYKQSGQSITATELTLLDQKTLAIPLKGKKHILIYWATWCPPCQYELSQLDRAIKDKELPRDRIIAINTGEAPGLVKKWMKKNDHDFIVAWEPSQKLSRQIQVTSTPTIVQIDEKGNIDSISSGIKPFFISRSRWFLAD